MANVFREGMDMPVEPDDAMVRRKPRKDSMMPVERMKPERMKPKRTLPKKRMSPVFREGMDMPVEPDDASVGMKCGGKVKKYSSGGKVRGDGIAKRGKTKGRVC